MNDLELRRAVLDELEYCPQLTAQTIGVAVEDGVVSLTGHVPTYGQKLIVERAVQSLKGVKAIAEDLEVRSVDDETLADDEIAARCLDLIRWNANLPDDRIQVKVQHGWVTLQGELPWHHQKHAAERAVRTLAGVSGIDNRIVVRPANQATNIKAQIEAALQRNAELDHRHIRVDVQDKSVRLDGYVHLWRERKAAEHAAWAAPGVEHVDNHLLIA